MRVELGEMGDGEGSLGGISDGKRGFAVGGFGGLRTEVFGERALVLGWSIFLLTSRCGGCFSTSNFGLAVISIGFSEPGCGAGGSATRFFDCSRAFEVDITSESSAIGDSVRRLVRGVILSVNEFDSISG